MLKLSNKSKRKTVLATIFTNKIPATFKDEDENPALENTLSPCPPGE